MINRRKYIKNTYLRGINKYEHRIFEDKNNECFISIKKILELDNPFFTSSNICLINKNYYITLSNGFDNLNNSLYYDDLYLDVVKQSDNITILDEDELDDALENKFINKEEYELAINKKNELIDSLIKNYNKFMKINILKYL